MSSSYTTVFWLLVYVTMTHRIRHFCFESSCQISRTEEDSTQTEIYFQNIWSYKHRFVYSLWGLEHLKPNLKLSREKYCNATQLGIKKFILLKGTVSVISKDLRQIKWRVTWIYVSSLFNRLFKVCFWCNKSKKWKLASIIN